MLRVGGFVECCCSAFSPSRDSAFFWGDSGFQFHEAPAAPWRHCRPPLKALARGLGARWALPSRRGFAIVPSVSPRVPLQNFVFVPAVLCPAGECHPKFPAGLQCGPLRTQTCLLPQRHAQRRLRHRVLPGHRTEHVPVPSSGCPFQPAQVPVSFKGSVRFSRHAVEHKVAAPAGAV